MAKYIAKRAFTLNNDGKAIEFAGGDVIPDDLAKHWYIKDDLAAGAVALIEDKPAAPVKDPGKDDGKDDGKGK